MACRAYNDFRLYTDLFKNNCEQTTSQTPFPTTGFPATKFVPGHEVCSLGLLPSLLMNVPIYKFSAPGPVRTGAS